MLALEHVLAHPEEVAGLVLSSTLCDASQWAEEVALLRDELPDEQRALLVANDPDAPGLSEAEAAFDARHFHRLEPRAPRLAPRARPEGPPLVRGDVGAERVRRSRVVSPAGT